MAFGPRNAYYLRVSANTVLPLFLYLDERHIEWMSDLVLQHVLADLRPLILPKLRAERDVHFGPGTAPGSKRGTVEVHRSETYQFAYFFRKTEPHTVLSKSRYFITAPVPSQVASKSSSMRPTDRNSQKKRSRAQATSQSKHKRARTSKGKNKSLQSHLDEDEWPAEDSENENDTDDSDLIPRKTRPVQRRRRAVDNASNDDNEGNVQQDVIMDSPPPEADGDSSRDSSFIIASDEDDRAGFLPEAADVNLVVEEEEEKPKPLLKLRYQSFPITGHCLCVVVEPRPSLRAETPARSRGSEAHVQFAGLEQSLIQTSEPVTTGQRAKTPLFFPEDDRAPSEAPSARERTLPPVPLFHDAVSRNDDDGLMNFSQTLNAVGHMHALAADDDDDMDGAILFGDADEIRELY